MTFADWYIVIDIHTLIRLMTRSMLCNANAK